MLEIMLITSLLFNIYDNKETYIRNYRNYIIDKKLEPYKEQLDRISYRESRNIWNIVNPESNALGKYQFVHIAFKDMELSGTPYPDALTFLNDSIMQKEYAYCYIKRLEYYYGEGIKYNLYNIWGGVKY